MSGELARPHLAIILEADEQKLLVTNHNEVIGVSDALIVVEHKLALFGLKIQAEDGKVPSLSGFGCVLFH